MILVRWRVIFFFFFPDLGPRSKAPQPLSGRQKWRGEGGVLRCNSVDLVVEKAWRKCLKKIGKERKSSRVYASADERKMFF